MSDFCWRLRGFMDFWGVILGAIAAVVVACNYYEKYMCYAHEQVTGQKTEHVNFSACYVEYEGRMTRWEVYKAKVLASGGMNNIADAIEEEK